MIVIEKDYRNYFHYEMVNIKQKKCLELGLQPSVIHRNKKRLSIHLSISFLPVEQGSSFLYLIGSGRSQAQLQQRPALSILQFGDRDILL